MASPAMASQHGMKGMGMMHHDGMGMMSQRGGGWKASLTEEQRNKVGKLKLDYKKQVYPLKTKIKQAKVELALLMIADKPNQKNIDKKIDSIVKLKAKKMRLKARHKVNVRKVLDATQRVKFDMKVLKKAYHGKGKKRGYHHAR